MGEEGRGAGSDAGRERERYIGGGAQAVSLGERESSDQSRVSYHPGRPGGARILNTECGQWGKMSSEESHLV